MIPDWLFQVMWYGAGVGGTGAIWYFLSEGNYHAVFWTGFGTAIAVLLTIALHIRNDLLKKEMQPATANAGPASERPALENLPTVVSPFFSQRPDQDMGVEQVSPDITSDKATPERPTIREKSAAEILSTLHQQLLLAGSSRELRRILYEAEEFLSRHPRNPDALMLYNDIRTALVKEESFFGGKYTQHYDQASGHGTWHTAPSLVSRIVPILLAASFVLGTGYGIYKLILWLLDR